MKLYFDEKKDKFDELTVCGYKIRFDIYSYVHILSRHFYPSMNKLLGVSLNKKNKVLGDLDELPSIILSLAEKYALKSGLSNCTEYLLYEIKGEKYILWIKYNSCGNFTCFQIRSFYNCNKKNDLDKFDNKIKVGIAADVYIYC